LGYARGLIEGFSQMATSLNYKLGDKICHKCNFHNLNFSGLFLLSINHFLTKSVLVVPSREQGSRSLFMDLKEEVIVVVVKALTNEEAFQFKKQQWPSNGEAKKDEDQRRSKLQQR